MSPRENVYIFRVKVLDHWDNSVDRTEHFELLDTGNNRTTDQTTVYTCDSRSYRICLTNEEGTSLSSNLNTENWQLKTVTEFLAAHNNHTGYTQTIRERTTNADGTTKSIDYTFSYDEISQRVVERDAVGDISLALLQFTSRALRRSLQWYCWRN